MTIDKFLAELKKCAHTYVWKFLPIAVGDQILYMIRAYRGNQMLCPIEAVTGTIGAFYSGLRLGLSEIDVRAIMRSADERYKISHDGGTEQLNHKILEAIYEGTM